MARSILTSPFHPHDSNFIPLTPPAVAVSTSGASVGKKQFLKLVNQFNRKPLPQNRVTGFKHCFLPTEAPEVDTATAGGVKGIKFESCG